jgi:hypothetical protein
VSKTKRGGRHGKLTAWPTPSLNTPFTVRVEIKPIWNKDVTIDVTIYITVDVTAHITINKFVQMTKDSQRVTIDRYVTINRYI